MTDGVFKSGDNGLEFVGDFDWVYRHNKDPWEQSTKVGAMAEYYKYSRRTLIDGLIKLDIPDDALGIEIGCGHGHLTSMLNEEVCLFFGVDISKEAVNKARELYPALLFSHDDILSDNFHSNGGTYILLWAQILWYVLHNMKLAIDNSLAGLEPGGFFVITQAFLYKQQYGNDIIDGFNGAVKVFLEHPDLQLVHAEYDYRGKLIHKDGLLIFRKVPQNADRIYR